MLREGCIEGFGNYYITSCGQVWNFKLGRCVRQRRDKNGYCICTLFDDEGQRRDMKVHRLVALAYLPNPNKLATVDHINGIKDDNRLVNLQWMSAADNSNKAHNRSCRCVETNESFVSRSAAGRKYGVSAGTIYSAIKTGGTAAGFHWSDA